MLTGEFCEMLVDVLGHARHSHLAEIDGVRDIVDVWRVTQSVVGVKLKNGKQYRLKVEPVPNT